jgi:ABC-type cobalamin transport system ATPase subunit
VLVGRGEQFAALATALDRDVPVVVLGEAGVGKTTLLREVAGASGRRVFEGGGLSTLQWLEYLALDRAVGRRVAAGDPAAGAPHEGATGGARGVMVVD